MWLMRRSILLLLGVRIWAASRRQSFVIRRATVIAFFPAVTEKKLKNDPDTQEALSDFQWYLHEAREPLLKLGVDLKVVYDDGFDVRIDGRTVVFRPKVEQAGYYLVAPGSAPRVEYGVRTDIDLITFGTVLKASLHAVSPPR